MILEAATQFGALVPRAPLMAKVRGDRADRKPVNALQAIMAASSTSLGSSASGALLFLGLQLVLARQEDALSKLHVQREAWHGTECDKRLSGTHEVVLCHSRIALLR